MHDDILALGALDRLECPLDDVFARLGQHLHGHIIRDHILFDQCAHEVELGLGSGRKADLDLLEADLDEQLEKLQLLFQAHRNDERLVAIAQIDAAPYRRFVHILFLRPFHARFRRHEILSAVLFKSFHVVSSCIQTTKKLPSSSEDESCHSRGTTSLGAMHPLITYHCRIRSHDNG